MKHSFFSTKNFLVLGLSAVLIVVGFILLSQGPVDGFSSLTLAPLVLVIAYVIIVPIGILLPKSDKNSSGD
jgi:hypothetical protein